MESSPPLLASFSSTLRTARRARGTALVSLLALAQLAVLRKFFGGSPHVDTALLFPLILMFGFHMASFSRAIDDNDNATTMLVWRALFASNLAYGIILIPVLLRSGSCCPTPLSDAAAEALLLYGPLLATRVLLRHPRGHNTNSIGSAVSM